MMMNLLKFITHIHYKLQQNAETAFFPNDYILEVVNKALIYVYNYTLWNWTLVVDRVTSEEKTDKFKTHYKIYRPYYAYLDNIEHKRTNIPYNLGMVKFQSGNWFYTLEDQVTLSSKGNELVIIYHRAAPQYDKIDPNYEIDIPKDMLMALEMCVLWYLHPGGFEQGANLSNYYYNIMNDILKKQKQIYGFQLKPEDVKLDRLYTTKAEGLPFRIVYY